MIERLLRRKEPALDGGSDDRFLDLAFHKAAVNAPHEDQLKEVVALALVTQERRDPARTHNETCNV